MTVAERKLLLLATWVATVAIVGLILTMGKPELWMLVATLAVAPALIASWLWDAPEATLSQLTARARARA